MEAKPSTQTGMDRDQGAEGSPEKEAKVKAQVQVLGQGSTMAPEQIEHAPQAAQEGPQGDDPAAEPASIDEAELADRQPDTIDRRQEIGPL